MVLALGLMVIGLFETRMPLPGFINEIYLGSNHLQSDVLEHYSIIASNFHFPKLNPGNLGLSIHKRRLLNLAHGLMVLALGLMVMVCLRLECLCLVSLMRYISVQIIYKVMYSNIIVSNFHFPK